MHNLPAREKFDLAEKVAQYLILAGSLDKNAALEDYELANQLSLELAMLLPAAIYRAVVDAAAHPNAKVNAATVAIMMRAELIAPNEGNLQADQVAVHTPGVAPRPPKGTSH